MGKVVKVGENVKKWENVWEVGKSGEKLGKVWKSVKNWENMVKVGKSGKSLRKCENV